MTEEERTFEAFSEKLFNSYLEYNPQNGTDIGLHEYDGKIGSANSDDIEKERAFYKDMLNTIQTINRSVLSDNNKFEYDIAKWAIESEIFNIEELQVYKKNPRVYIGMFSQIDNYIKRDYAPFDERLRSILEIMDKIPDSFDCAEVNLGNSIPEVFCKYAKLSCVNFEDFFRSKLLNVIIERTNNEKLISEYREKSIIAIESFRKFGKFIDRVSNKDDESYRLGKEKFLSMLRVKEHIDLPLEEIKRLGSEELERLQNNLKKVISENNFEGRIDQLEHDHPSEDNLISETRNLLDELIHFIRDNQIVDLPEKLNCIVTEMPKYDDFGFAAMGTAGPFEKSDESFYYINLPDKDWDDVKKKEWMTQFNYPILKLISIHEAYPGHYTHFLNANKYSSKLSKLFMSYSYVEGWAHYTEEMMIDEGYSKDDFKVKIGMYIEALIRCCRYIAAIGIHCENMSIDDAKDFFMKNAFMAETTAGQEAERGAFDPGYLNYTLGKIFLKRFKEKYFNKFGEEKSLKDFHNQIVSLGVPTYRIAESFVL